MLTIPNDSWLPVVPEFMSDETTRDPAKYIQCCKQFSVETHPRYIRGHTGHNETYCNIFVSDCTLALTAPIPHWIDLTTGRSVPVGKGTELNANAVCRWLRMFGSTQGWLSVASNVALTFVLLGKPSVVVWENLKGIGHVAMLLPTSTPTQLRIAQSGAVNFFDRPLVSGFGNAKPLFFYVHD